MIADRTPAAHGRIVRLAALPLLLAVGLLAAACSSAATPAPSTPLGPEASAGASSIATAEQAAAAVAADNPRFAGIEQQNPDMIGQGSFWEATPVESGAYGGGSPAGWKVTYTVGWGDCPAGCIYQHVWTYQVDADGTVTLLSETGDPLESRVAAQG
jgi:hypothetical protein